LATRVGASAAVHPLVVQFLEAPVRLTLTRTYDDPLRPSHDEVLGSLCPVDSPRWAIVTARDVEVAFAAVTSMAQRTFLLGLVAGVVAMTAGFFLARRITLPLRHLADVTTAVAGGDFARRVPVTSQNELGQLAANFNVMADEIERYIKSLRQALRDNQELLIDSIRALAAAIDAKNPYTRGHSEHVARYAVAIARHLGISGSELMRIEIAALLHDVGKIGIEDAILLKPQRLTDSEFQVMRTHPVKGAGIVASIKRLRDMLPGIRSHHESWDGTGYPDGLAGEKIPLLARIIAAADTFDAMTTERPYQMPMTFNAGLDRMRQLAGARLDPTVVGAFFKAVQTGDLVLLGQVEVA
jgi:HD-GYP domain-containing protein (c-di-GMP phosphodiesterase class II)